MKLKNCLWLALTVISLNVHASDIDKAAHFIGSTAISFASYSFLKDTQYPVAYSIALATAVGVAGEWHDKDTGHGFSKGDLAADFLGAVAGAYLGKKFYYQDKKLVYKTEF